MHAVKAINVAAAASHEAGQPCLARTWCGCTPASVSRQGAGVGAAARCELPAPAPACPPSLRTHLRITCSPHAAAPSPASSTADQGPGRG